METFFCLNGGSWSEKASNSWTSLNAIQFDSSEITCRRDGKKITLKIADDEFLLGAVRQFTKSIWRLDGCLTVHLPHEIK